MVSNNSKEHGNVFILRTVRTSTLYLDVFCFKAIFNVDEYLCVK